MSLWRFRRPRVGTRFGRRLSVHSCGNCVLTRVGDYGYERPARQQYPKTTCRTHMMGEQLRGSFVEVEQPAEPRLPAHSTAPGVGALSIRCSVPLSGGAH